MKQESIQLYHQDAFATFKKFEGQNMSYSVFENINFREFMQPVSFFRSDFRGAKFTKVNFYKNNFDRSDFLNSVFLDCTFDKVHFGCCQMKNCYFSKVRFSNNLYRNTSIHSTTFVDCEFPDETFLINMQHCKLINCSFSGCCFEMSTTDSDSFENCTFVSTNLATMHAENHQFIKCRFENVCIDSSYFFGYSITECEWNFVTFLYRGEYVSFDDLKFSDFYTKYDLEHRYNELLNLLIQSRDEKNIPKVLAECFFYFKNKPYGRAHEISVILDSLTFSAIYETVDFDILTESLSIIADADVSEYNFEELMEFKASYSKLHNAVYLSPHSEEYLSRIDPNSKALLSIRLNNDDYETCISIANQLLNSVSDLQYWTLVDEQKGSWILVYVAATFIVVSTLPKILKNYADVYFDIKAKKTISNKLLKKLDDVDISIKDIKQITSVSQDAKLMMPAGKCINKDISKEIASITANL